MRKEPSRGARVARFRVPLWLVAVVLIPVGAVFVTSLLIATAVAVLGFAAFAFLGPLFFGTSRRQAPEGLRRTHGEAPGEIELDRSQYRRVSGPSERE